MVILRFDQGREKSRNEIRKKGRHLGTKKGNKELRKEGGEEGMKVRRKT